MQSTLNRQILIRSWSDLLCTTLNLIRTIMCLQQISRVNRFSGRERHCQTHLFRSARFNFMNYTRCTSCEFRTQFFSFSKFWLRNDCYLPVARWFHCLASEGQLHKFFLRWSLPFFRTWKKNYTILFSLWHLVFHVYTDTRTLDIDFKPLHTCQCKHLSTLYTTTALMNEIVNVTTTT